MKPTGKLNRKFPSEFMVYNSGKGTKLPMISGGMKPAKGTKKKGTKGTKKPNK